MDDLGKPLSFLTASELLWWSVERPNSVAAVLRQDALIDESMLDMTGMKNRLTVIAFAVRVTKMRLQQTSSKQCFS